MKHLLFTLTMPGVPSWNGHWTGENDSYVRSLSFTDTEFENLPPNFVGEHFYRWNDGWEACVSVKVVSKKTKEKRLKNSAGFCGYDWMIDSLLKSGEIKSKYD